VKVVAHVPAPVTHERDNKKQDKTKQAQANQQAKKDAKAAEALAAKAKKENNKVLTKQKVNIVEPLAPPKLTKVKGGYLPRHESILDME
jgi:hypothetical protein